MDRTKTLLVATVLAIAAPQLASGQAARSATPAPAAPIAVTAPTTPVATTSPKTPAGTPTQVLRVGDVRIEGKLYSPRALFILSRPEERFGRDVVVPQVLQLQRTATLLPYRLRPEILAAEQAALDGAAGSPAASNVPRRSP